MLVSMASSEALPYQIRTAACDLARAMYVERYPQVPFCGRPVLPEQLWVYEATVVHSSCSTMAVIRPLSLKDNDKETLPSFHVTNKQLLEDPDPTVRCVCACER